MGIGAWDVQAIRYGYAPDPAVPEAVLAENRQRGLRYVTDADARPTGAASPTGALWDNGADAVQALRDEMAVRRVALDRFSEAAIREGRPLATLEEVLVPLVLRHRYQVDATAHLVGGVSYGYADRGEAGPEPVGGDVQRQAIDALLATLLPEELALPDAALAQIPPRPPGYDATRELFDGRTGLTFDPVAPAETAAALTISFLLDPDRAARLATQHALDPSLPSFDGLLARTDAALSDAPAPTPYHAEIRRAVWGAWIDGLLALAADEDAAPAARAPAESYLAALAPRLRQWAADDAARGAWLAGRIERFLNRDFEPDEQPETLDVPPGSPIGQ